MLYLLFNVGGWIFYTVTSVFVISELLFIGFDEKRKYIVTPILFIIGLILFTNISQLVCNSSLFATIFTLAFLLASLKYAGFYILVGIVWALLFLYLKVRQRSQEMVDLKEKWISENLPSVSCATKLKDIAPLPRRNLYSYLYERIGNKSFYGLYFSPYHDGGDREDVSSSKIMMLDERFDKFTVPSISDNKAIITFWMSCWPVSILWWIFGDLIKDLYGHIMRKTKAIFAGVARYAAREI